MKSWKESWDTTERRFFDTQHQSPSPNAERRRYARVQRVSKKAADATRAHTTSRGPGGVGSDAE